MAMPKGIKLEKKCRNINCRKKIKGTYQKDFCPSCLGASLRASSEVEVQNE